MGRPVDYSWILDVIPANVLAKLPPFLLDPDPTIYLSDNYVVFDFETNTRGDDGSPLAIFPQNNVVCGSWCTNTGDATNIYGNQMEMEPMLAAMREADFIVAHNGKFDIGYLVRAGIDPYKIILWDTQIAEFCLDGNRKKKRTLDALFQLYFPELRGKLGYVEACMKGGVDPADIPEGRLVTRCNEDVLMTRRLFKEQRDKIERKGMLGHVYTRCLLSPALESIERKGMYLDAEAVEKLYVERATARAVSAAALDEFTGGINPNSPKQMKEYIYETLKFKPKYKGKGKNKTPIYSTKTDDLLRLKATNKKQRDFVRLKKAYSGFNADVTKNLLFFHGVVTDPDSESPLFYANFNQCVAVTHRLSSSGIKRIFPHLLDDKGKVVMKSVQFQNFKREFKCIMKARNEEWLMGEADGSQLEFRSAAFQAQCKTAIQAIVNNLDVHADTASQLHGMDRDEFVRKHAAHDPEVEGWRQDAKADTFKPLYGGQSGTPEQVKYYEWFRKNYDGIGRQQEKWKLEAVRTKKVKLAHGFTFYFPNCREQNSGYITDSTNICNYPVQHFATAEIIPIAVVYLWHLMREMESFLVNTIHDSAIAELHPDEVEMFKEYSMYAFTHLVYYYLAVVYGVEFNCPLGVGVKVGRNWGKGDEVKCAPQPPFEMDGIDYSQLLTDWVEG